MPYVDPNSIHNPATGTSPPATWGDNVRDNIVWLAGDAASGGPKPMCRVYNNASINIATATNTALTFNSERYDVGGMHSTSVNTSRITIPTGGGGVYHLGGCVVFASNATGVRAVWLMLNGATRIVQQAQPASSATDQAITVSCDYKLAAADYVELFVFQSSGGILAVNSTSAYTPEAWCHWVGLG